MTRATLLLAMILATTAYAASTTTVPRRLATSTTVPKASGPSCPSALVTCADGTSITFETRDEAERFKRGRGADASCSISKNECP